MAGPLLDQCGLRFVYGAPMLKGVTRRVFWATDSRTLCDPRMQDPLPRRGLTRAQRFKHPFATTCREASALC
jgi:hypothetical protein